jgi:hypothetical protein
VIGRAAWLLGIAGLGVLAAGAQLDRQSQDDPSLARHVPTPFRSFAQLHLASEALAGGSRAQAMAEARRLVRRRPMPAESLYLLAGAQQQAGDVEHSLVTVQHSALRGWRLPPAQDVMFRIAMASGDLTEAANRLAALWAAAPADAARDELTRVLLAAPGGPQAFARPLSGTRIWRDEFAGTALDIAPAGQVAATMMQARRLGARFDCARISDLAAGLAGQGAIDEANRLWSGTCAGATKAAQGDVAFAPSGRAQGPFGWTYPDASGVTLDLRQQGALTVLDAMSEVPGMQLIARRVVALRPGAHQLVITSDEASSGEERGLLQVSVDCLAPGGHAARIASRIGEGSLPLAIPPAGCPAARIELRTGKGARRGLQLELR